MAETYKCIRRSSTKMFDNVKREFIQEKGLSNGDTTKRSDIFKDYQLSVSKDKRLSGTWTLEQYEGQYRAAMYAAVKSANPNWKPGQAFDTGILDNVTRESVEATLVQMVTDSFVILLMYRYKREKRIDFKKAANHLNILWMICRLDF